MPRERNMTRAVPILLLSSLIIAAECGSSPAAGGGSSGGGGALGGGGGRGGTAGGTAGAGGGGGQTGGVTGHGGTDGSAGGAGTSGSGGSGGAAGDGPGGFNCAGVTLDGDCSTYPVGLVCVLPGGEALTPCVCMPANGGPRWACNGTSPCPYQQGTSGCSQSTITTITNFGGCKYPTATVCSCEAADGGAAWSCNNAACPAMPPTGSCAGSPAAGFSCDYAGTAIACDCVNADGGAARWRCNGQATPDCPDSWPGSGVDCSAFQPGTVCPFPAGNVIGGPCTCASDGNGLTWHCSNG
jgi:hypothetical protein